MVPNVNIPRMGGLYGLSLVAAGNNVFFTADDGIHGEELWKSDGTAAGTGMVKDINPGQTTLPYGVLPFPKSSYPRDLTAVGGTLYFLADDGVHGVGLWQSGGTAANTRPLPGVGPKTTFALDSSLLAGGNGALYFTADDGVHGMQLWKLQ
jgi:ELWxxDGT repeat protein